MQGTSSLGCLDCYIFGGGKSCQWELGILKNEDEIQLHREKKH